MQSKQCVLIFTNIFAKVFRQRKNRNYETK